VTAVGRRIICMGVTRVLLTAEQFDNYDFQEDKRYELDEGELIEMTRPAYKHNRVLMRLGLRLGVFLEQSKLGEALNSENLFALSSLTRRAPDLAIILGDPSKELADAKVIHKIPEIVMEVLSPSETPRMIVRKLKQYFEAGVKEVWLIDPDEKEVEIWTGPSLPDRALALADSIQSKLLPGFSLPLADLFG